LVRVEVPTHTWSLDNMVFSQVPEPTCIALVLAGGLVLGALRFRRVAVSGHRGQPESPRRPIFD
jgi:hypothetical protein